MKQIEFSVLGLHKIAFNNTSHHRHGHRGHRRQAFIFNTSHPHGPSDTQQSFDPSLPLIETATVYFAGQSIPTHPEPRI